MTYIRQAIAADIACKLTAQVTKLLEADDPIIYRECAVNPNWGVSVWPYLEGQLRVKVHDLTKKQGSWRDYGDIAQELCTYDITTAFKIFAEILVAQEPLETAQDTATKFNSTTDAKRIRLDNKEGRFPQA